MSSAPSSVAPLNLRMQKVPASPCEAQHYTNMLLLDIAQVLAARLLSFVHINVLGNHTEGLLNLMAQTITKKFP